jgi:Chaperone of endosialidase
MNRPIQLSTAILPVPNLISRSPLRRSFPVVLLAITLTSFMLLRSARAVTPPPDGGYPNFNTAEGDFALYHLTSGGLNTAIGYQALYENDIGSYNTAIGEDALYANTTGNNNTSCGFDALLSNNGDNNTASGFEALFTNNTGFNNTASGYQALLDNTGGFNNSANGVSALLSNTTGFANTADGFTALQNNTTGNSNTAAGDGALASNTTGSRNIAVGISAGINLTTGSNNIDIGAPGVAAEANTIRIGKSGTQKKTFIAGIRGVTVASGVGVVVGSTGQLGTVVSSARFKEAIKPMDKASEAILALKPVTFRYKHELDPDSIPQFGLVAEDVEKVNPDLVARDAEGKPYTVRYEAVNAMLLNEFLKEHRKNEEQEATIARLQKQVDALTAGLQKMSAQLELSKAAPQTVLNNQ